MSAVELIATI